MHAHLCQFSQHGMWIYVYIWGGLGSGVVVGGGFLHVRYCVNSLVPKDARVSTHFGTPFQWWPISICSAVVQLKFLEVRLFFMNCYVVKRNFHWRWRKTLFMNSYSASMMSCISETVRRMDNLDTWHFWNCHIDNHRQTVKYSTHDLTADSTHAVTACYMQALHWESSRKDILPTAN